MSRCYTTIGTILVTHLMVICTTSSSWIISRGNCAVSSGAIFVTSPQISRTGGDDLILVVWVDIKYYAASEISYNNMLSPCLAMVPFGEHLNNVWPPGLMKTSYMMQLVCKPYCNYIIYKNCAFVEQTAYIDIK